MSAEYCHYCNAPVGAGDAQCPGCGQALVLQGRYRLSRIVGKGGFGAVYEAYDARLKRRCAIKKVAIASLLDQQQIEAEVALLSRYSQEFPFLCEVDDYWIDAGQAYMVMEYVDGQSLDELLAQQRRLPPAEVEHFLSTLLGYLAQLHGAGVVHRDLKPSNIRRTPQGRYVLLDLGIAKSGAATQTAARALTLDYSPPEQLRGETTDARSDLYSLAATAYHLLTGSPPENAGVRVRSGAPLASPAQLVTDTPAALSNLLVEMLALDQARRPQSAQAALDHLQGGAPDASRTIRQAALGAATLPSVPAAPGGPAGKVAPGSAGKQPLWQTLLIVAVALLVLGTIGALGSGRRRFQAEPTAITVDVEIPTLEPIGLGSRTIEPTMAIEPAVLKGGFGQDGNQVGAAFLIQNPDSSTAIHSLEYKFVAYASSGTVLHTTSTNYIYVLNAGAEAYVADSFYVPDDRKVERVEIRFEGSRTGPALAFSSNELTTADAAYAEREFGNDQISGLLINESFHDLDTVLVSAVAFDEDGAIIGGGSTYVGFVPASGRASVEVSSVTSAAPARVELHPRLTISSGVE